MRINSPKVIDEELDAMLLEKEEENTPRIVRNVEGGKKRKSNKKRKWSLKYKRSINCKKPKGFSQRQYCKRINKTKKIKK
jgi:hypothetical protein